MTQDVLTKLLSLSTQKVKRDKTTFTFHIESEKRQTTKTKMRSKSLVAPLALAPNSPPPNRWPPKPPSWYPRCLGGGLGGQIYLVWIQMRILASYRRDIFAYSYVSFIREHENLDNNHSQTSLKHNNSWTHIGRKGVGKFSSIQQLTIGMSNQSIDRLKWIVSSNID